MRLLPWRRRVEVVPENWLIESATHPRWQVRLAGCDRAHAEAVLKDLLNDPSCPDDSTLREE